MSAPTASVRSAVYSRDGRKCADCGTTEGLSFGHRRAVGMGGSKVRPEVCDGVCLCLPCNEADEASGQREALFVGHKVQKWVRYPENVPVFYVRERQWYRLVFDGTRERITAVVAAQLMRAVYGAEWDEWAHLLGGRVAIAGYVGGEAKP